MADAGAHLFLACGAGRAGGGGACTQSLLDVEVQSVQLSHQLAHGLRPGSLEQRRLLRDGEERESGMSNVEKVFMRFTLGSH